MTHVVLPHFLQGYDKSHLTSDDGDVFLVKALKHPIEDLVECNNNRLVWVKWILSS